MTREQSLRAGSPVATALRSELAAALGRSVDVALAYWLGEGDSDTSAAARGAVDALRMALVSYVVHGLDPVASLRDDPAIGPVAPVIWAYAEAREDAARRLETALGGAATAGDPRDGLGEGVC